MSAPASAQRTAIRAGWIIAHDGRGHRLLRDGVVVFEGDTILHVGPRFDGRVDVAIDGADRVVTPGLISTHAHIAGSPLDRSFIEDVGNPQFYNSGLFEMLPVRGAAQDEGGTRACVEFSLVEMLRGGCTTVAEMGGAGEIVAEMAGRYGMRVYLAQGYRSGRWLTRDGKQVLWEWDEEGGRRGLQRAIDFIDRFDGAHGGLVRGFLSPMQVDTCSAELLRESYRLAEERRLPMQVHTSQSVNEFQEMLRRHGKTPIAWLSEIGALGPQTILGHAIIVGGSSWANYPPGDLRIMAESGCSVAHAPWVFARRGIAMESFARYREAGITMSLGTDTNPQSMIEAMRWASVVSKIVDRRTLVAPGADVFDAATLGGARALGRDDLGRIAPGAKADLVLWRATSWTMTPLRDPVKNIVFNATSEDVAEVYVNGRQVVRDGRVAGADERRILAELQAAGERMWPRMAEFDWSGRGADELSPQTYAAWPPSPGSSAGPQY
ncbi:MAG TPA: chlorohydrolase family protein [Dehalococcoidia bacterium]|nr:chlorohydrolase family protein [Dehalococcoidia bacterium]